MGGGGSRVKPSIHSPWDLNTFRAMARVRVLPSWDQDLVAPQMSWGFACVSPCPLSHSDLKGKDVTVSCTNGWGQVTHCE